MAESRDVEVPVRLLKLTGSSWIGVASAGGMQIRGRRCPDPLRALQSTLAELSATGNDEAVLALELMLEGSTLDDAMAPASLDAGQLAPGKIAGGEPVD